MILYEHIKTYGLIFCSWLIMILSGISLVAISPGLAYTAAAEGAKTLTITDAEKSIKEYITSHSPWEESQIKVKNVSIPNTINIPEDGVFNITASPKSALIGRTAFSFNVKNENVTSQTYWITADIEVWVDVVLTSRSLKDHQIINGNDIYSGKQNLSDLPAGYLYSTDDVIGKRLKRFVAGNRPLSADVLEEPPIFKRGDKVFIIAESDNLKITTVGTASEDGFRNRPVKVVNLQSKREVFGDVIDGGTIKVRW